MPQSAPLLTRPLMGWSPYSVRPVPTPGRPASLPPPIFLPPGIITNQATPYGPVQIPAPVNVLPTPTSFRGVPINPSSIVNPNTSEPSIFLVSPSLSQPGVVLPFDGPGGIPYGGPGGESVPGSDFSDLYSSPLAEVEGRGKLAAELADPTSTSRLGLLAMGLLSPVPGLALLGGAGMGAHNRDALLDAFDRASPTEQAQALADRDVSRALADAWLASGRAEQEGLGSLLGRGGGVTTTAEAELAGEGIEAGGGTYGGGNVDLTAPDTAAVDTALADAATADAAADANAAALAGEGIEAGGGNYGGGDVGGSSGGGGCFLVTYATDFLPTPQRDSIRRFFKELSTNYGAKHPEGRELFRQYQNVSKRILDKLTLQPPDVQRSAAAFILNEVAPVGDRQADPSNIKFVPTRLESVTRQLASWLDIPVPKAQHREVRV